MFLVGLNIDSSNPSGMFFYVIIIKMLGQSIGAMKFVIENVLPIRIADPVIDLVIYIKLKRNSVQPT